MTLKTRFSKAGRILWERAVTFSKRHGRAVQVDSIKPRVESAWGFSS